MSRRDIKFRAWDKNDHKMISTSSIHSTPYCLMLTLDGDLRDIAYERDEDKDFPVMQFTGLLDKNGKEIYEGDIFDSKMWFECDDDPSHVDCDHKSIVEFRDGKFTTSYFGEGEECHGDREWWEEVEIIGNIYEHGHLLKSD